MKHEKNKKKRYSENEEEKMILEEMNKEKLSRKQNRQQELRKLDEIRRKQLEKKIIEKQSATESIQYAIQDYQKEKKDLSQMKKLE